METSFSQYSDPFESYLENYLGGHANYAAPDVISAHRKSPSDEDVILATNRPKKRAGRKKFQETRHPVYRGVRRRNSNRWVCEVREPNKQNRIWLGTYPTPEMAARAHDVAALAFRGPKACLNFADSSWRLPVPISSEAKDIQKAAAEAAEAFRLGEFDDGRSENFDQVRSDEMMKMRSDEVSSTNLNSTGNVFYTDEEMIFGMPGLLTSMAEGLLLSPPSYLSGDFGGDDGDNMHGDVSLWNHSV